jgi:alkylated DNA repair dioxygenase AlkB
MSAKKVSESTELPSGFRYEQDFLDLKEEANLLERFRNLEFRPFNFQGYVAKRRIVEYGFQYDFTSRHTTATEAIPDFLQGLREKAATWAEVATAEIVEAVVTEYPPGAPIGWHRDVPQFDVIIGISLAGSCRMRLKPYKDKGRITSVTLEPRSVYAMRGIARWHYQHSIPPVKELRYSVTFRTLNQSRKVSIEKLNRKSAPS